MNFKPRPPVPTATLPRVWLVINTTMTEATALFTDAEMKFLTMMKMIGLVTPSGFVSRIPSRDVAAFLVGEIVKTIIMWEHQRWSEKFGIIAQSFAELCRERPELQPFYDRAESAANGG